MNQFDVAIVGSGFAGSVLARCLNQRGRRVLLLEKGHHARFAIGESSTPLAAIALERLAARFGLEDLDQLAAHGRWVESLPHLRRGLKRGFTFYAQNPEQELLPTPNSRLLVAASPDDSVADCHWLRADVDAFLVEKAAAEGVVFRDGVAVTSVSESNGGVKISGRGEDGPFEATAGFVVDGSGPAAVVARQFGATNRSRPARFRSSVVFSHFSGVVPLESVWEHDGVPFETGPYPDERGAVHHLLEEGWVYVLPFDHDCVSAGFVADGELAPDDGDRAWQQVLEKYPTLARQFGGATTLRPMTVINPLQYRMTRAVGRRWAALPLAYSFFDPMFSTGIAGSLINVERLAGLLETGVRPRDEDLELYEVGLSAEADQAERLLYGAHLARPDFAVYVAHSQLYFALVSFEEVRQRIWSGAEDDAGGGSFLGAGDTWAEQLLGEGVARLEQWVSGGRTASEGREYVEWVGQAIASRNVAGLMDPGRRNLYPVDMDLLVDRSHLLGVDRDEMVELLPQLRGERPEA